MGVLGHTAEGHLYVTIGAGTLSGTVELHQVGKQT